VEVFCRVRPSAEEEESCIKILSDTTVQLTPPESSRAFVSGKETQYTFKGNRFLSQSCGSGSAWIRINMSCWIRIRIQEGKNYPQQ
jgi:hypothetical protein